MNLTIQTTEDKEKSCLNLSGEIDAYTAPQLKEALLPLTSKSETQVEVNLQNVTYMDSTGLGVFVSALKSSKANDSKLKLVNLQERVRRLFKITGLDEVIDINDKVRGGNT